MFGTGRLSPTLLTILSGYFGSRIDYAMTLLASAIITGGIGPLQPDDHSHCWARVQFCDIFVNKFAWRSQLRLSVKRIRWFVGHIVWGNHEPVVLAPFRRRRWADFFSHAGALKTSSDTLRNIWRLLCVGYHAQWEIFYSSP